MKYDKNITCWHIKDHTHTHIGKHTRIDTHTHTHTHMHICRNACIYERMLRLTSYLCFTLKPWKQYNFIYMQKNAHTHTNTHTHWRVLIERNSLSVDDNIYAPPWRLSSLAKELPAAASVMQSSSKELSTLVAVRVLKKCKQRLLLLFLKIKGR